MMPGDVQAEMAELRALADSIPSWELAQAWEALAMRLVVRLAAPCACNASVTLPETLPSAEL